MITRSRAACRCSARWRSRALVIVPQADGRPDRRPRRPDHGHEATTPPSTRPTSPPTTRPTTVRTRYRACSRIRRSPCWSGRGREADIPSIPPSPRPTTGRTEKWVGGTGPGRRARGSGAAGGARARRRGHARRRQRTCPAAVVRFFFAFGLAGDGGSSPNHQQAQRHGPLRGPEGPLSLVGGDPVVLVDLGLVEFQERRQRRHGLEIRELLRVHLLLPLGRLFSRLQLKLLPADLLTGRYSAAPATEDTVTAIRIHRSSGSGWREAGRSSRRTWPASRRA